METVEGTAIGHEAGALGLKDLPDRLAGDLGMGAHLRPLGAAVGKPVVELLQALHPHPRREEVLPYRADLVLDLALLPAGGWGAGSSLSRHRFERR